eukprot:6212405-Pleurochrysis_carterae.AAC.8
MELTLVRQDLFQTSTTARKCMHLLPGKKRQQKIVVGDASGSLMCVGMRREVVEPVFKTPEVSRGEIGRVEVSADKATDTARIFWASGMTVNGITGKGKEFLRFNTNLAEPIRSMHVIGEEIHTGGEFIYNQFVNCKEAEFFMVRRTQVSAIIAAPPSIPSLHQEPLPSPSIHLPLPMH